MMQSESTPQRVIPPDPGGSDTDCPRDLKTKRIKQMPRERSCLNSIQERKGRCDAVVAAGLTRSCWAARPLCRICRDEAHDKVLVGSCGLGDLGGVVALGKSSLGAHLCTGTSQREGVNGSHVETRVYDGRMAAVISTATEAVIIITIIIVVIIIIIITVVVIIIIIIITIVVVIIIIIIIIRLREQQ